MASTPVPIGTNTVVGFNISVPFTTTDQFSFSFPYLDQSHFRIEVASETTLDAADYEFVSDYLIQLTQTGVDKLNALYTTGTVDLIIYRATKLDTRFVDFQDGANLTEKDLDLNSNQTFYLIQEANDTLLAGTLGFNPVTGSVDAGGKEIIDLGYASQLTSAANLNVVLDNAILPEYTEGDVYRDKRMVMYSGSYYRANKDIDDAPAVFEVADWDLVVSQSDLSQIAPNTTQIATNVTDIGTNTTNIATNVTDIDTNTTDIATNVTDIGTNVANIDTNVTDISTNVANIATNVTDIGTNVTDIATNTSNLAAHEALTNTHQNEDTELNLEAWAVNAANGEHAYATDTKKYYGVEDGLLAEFGGGGGGEEVNIRHSESFTSTPPTTYGSVSNAAITRASETVNQLSGDRSLKLTQSSSLATYYFQSENFSISAREFKKDFGYIGLEFLSEVTNGVRGDFTIELFVNDGVDRSLGLFDIEGGSKDNLIRFEVESADTIFFFRIYTATPDDTFTLLLDKLRINLDPDITVKDVESESFRVAYQTSFWDSTGDTDEWDHSLASPSFTNSKLLNVVDELGQTRIYARQTSIVSLSIAASSDVNGILSICDSDGNEFGNSQASSAGGYKIGTSAEFQLQGGDYIYLRNNNPFSDAAGSLTITATKASANKVFEGGVDVRDTQSYTPTFQGFGTPTNVDFTWRQTGDAVVIQGSFTTGTPNGSEAQIGLPSGYTIKNSGTIKNIGSYTYSASNSNNGGFVLATGGDSYFNFTSRNVFGDGASLALTPTVGSSTVYTSGQQMSFTAIVSVNELSAKEHTLLYAVSEKFQVMSGTTTNTDETRYFENFEEVGSESYFTATGTGVVGVETVSPLEGNRTVKLTASAVNDSFEGAGLFVDRPEYKVNYIGLEFLASNAGDKGDMYAVAQAWNGATWDDLVTQDIEAGEKSYLLRLKLQDTHTTLRLLFKSSVASSEIFVDKARVDLDPDMTVKDANVNSVGLEGSDGRTITAMTDSIPFNGSSTGWVSGANGSNFTNGNYYKVQYSNSVVNLVGSVNESGPTDSDLYLYVNGTQKAVIYDSRSTHLQGSKAFSYLSKAGQFNIGDKIAIASGATLSLSASDTRHYLNIVETQVGLNKVIKSQASVEDIVVECAGNAAESITQQVTDIPFVATVDSIGAWNGSQFTVPESGIYVIGGMVTVSSVASANAELYVNGVKKVESSRDLSQDQYPFNYNLYLKENDVLSVRLNRNATLLNIATAHHLSITKQAINPIYSIPQDTIEPTVTKVLSSDVTNNGTIAELTTSLEIGREYDLTVNLDMNIGGQDGYGGIIAKHDGDNILVASAGERDTLGSIFGLSKRLIFTAKTDTITFEGYSLGSVTQINGNGTTEETFIQLIKRSKDGVVANVAKVNHKIGGVEYETGELYAGQKIYARSYEGNYASPSVYLGFTASKIIRQTGGMLYSATREFPFPYSDGNAWSLVERNPSDDKVYVTNNVARDCFFTIEYIK